MAGFSFIFHSRGFSKISRLSTFSRISRKWTFLKRPLFQKTPFFRTRGENFGALFLRKFVTLSLSLSLYVSLFVSLSVCLLSLSLEKIIRANFVLQTRHPDLFSLCFGPPYMEIQCRENKNVYRHQSPPFFKKGHAMGKKMAGTNEFAFFRCKSICTGGGGPESGRKKNRKMPSGRYRYKNLLFQQCFCWAASVRHLFIARKAPSLTSNRTFGWPTSHRVTPKF